MIIFGGTKGIGKMLAEHYCKNGFNVSVSGRNIKKLKKTQDQVFYIKTDVSKENSVASAFKSHVKKWGKSPNVVINCAAVQGPIGNSWEIEAEEFEETLKINLLGSFIVSKVAIKTMLPNKQGSIIMFSGGGAVFARPNFSAYGVSKTGVLRLVETIAKELIIAECFDININAIAPGAVKTQMTNEVIKAGKRAGKNALDEAFQVIATGGTKAKEIINLVDFLIDRKLNNNLTGRLIHVREDYQNLVAKYGNKIPDELGKIRRIQI